MSHSATFYDRFFASISAGLLVTAFGAILLFVAAIWFSRLPEPFIGDRPPSGPRALSTIGFVLLLVGLAWQLVGYRSFIRW
jgi:uncharacterized membrane protein